MTTQRNSRIKNRTFPLGVHRAHCPTELLIWALQILKKRFKKSIVPAVLYGLGSLEITCAAPPLPVFVSIPPQKYFVEKIGGEWVSVSVMVPPGSNPHNYEPRPSQMIALSKAKIYFAVGITFEEAWLDKFSAINPRLLISHTEDGIERIPMTPHAHPGEGDGRHPVKDHNAWRMKDPHVWLEPNNVKIMAMNILKVLKEQTPSTARIYDENYRAFAKEIDDLDREIKSLFATKKGMKFMVFHPAWGYFARAYDLVQVPIEIEGKEPKLAQLNRLIQFARREKIAVVFVQPQFSTKSAETIAREIGGQVVMADDLAEDWARNLRDQARRFFSALK